MDEFTFPTIAAEQDSVCKLPFPHFASSPLWFLPSVKPELRTANAGHRRSFSSAVEALQADEDVFMRRDPEANRRVSGGRRALDEERMDKLWEDFNEELRRASWDRTRESKVNERAQERQKEAMLELCYMEGSIIHRRRPSLIVMLKVLKKLFWVQKAGSSKRTPLY